MVKIHGNYCGPNWTGGKPYAASDSRVDWTVPCVDSLDCACKKHDRDCSHPQGCSAKGDRALIKTAAIVRTFSKDQGLRRKAEAIITGITVASLTRSR
jgi:hypothetical protein